ncbi:hypothetical protein PHYBOEH_007743 [Phytophthora boehmeriae]|uniref:Uncharacterized protein n=1 Tax=Phytophthora boehmeriae TaxID=109152 RepID=A0A8T1X0T7_9STRA|nr:hypothetical protein PHYBOEH_007743 [Phytophthora boehmeriae]
MTSAAASSVTTLVFHVATARRRITDITDDAADSASGSTEPETETSKAIHYVAISLLITMSAISSGLTLGLMSLDKIGLDVVVRAGERPGATADERKKAKAAKRILPVRTDGNLLLTTLVLTTVAVNSLLSILMADLTSGLVGFFLSTFLILIFGEIVPQSLCARHALAIGSALMPVVHLMRVSLYVFAKPVSAVLDRTVGEDVGTLFTKRELQKLLEIHVRQKIMHPEEGHIVRGAMSYKDKAVSEIMIPSERLFSLPISFLTLLYGSRVSAFLCHVCFLNPVDLFCLWNKDPNDVVGIVFAKDLIYVDPNENVPLIAFARVFAVAAHRIWLDAKLGEVLSVFKLGSTHMALVYDVNNSGPGDPFYELKGLVTLDDIMGEILQSKIMDEAGSPEAKKERKNRTDQIGFDGAHAAAAFGNKIWIVGGVSASYYTKRLEQTTSRSDVISSPDGVEWTDVLDEAPFRRRFGHSLIAFTDSSDNVERLTLIAGFSPEPATDIWVTVDGASWKESTATVPWAGRGYHCSVVFNSKLWVLGGSPMNNGVWSTSSVLTGSWEQQSNVPWTPRAAHSCATHEIVTNTTIGDASREKFIFLMGGWRETSLRDVWRMDSDGNWEMLLETAPWEARAWFSLVSFDSRTNGDVQLGPRLWVIGGGIVGKGIEKMHPFSDVWYTRDGVSWDAASSNSSGISTAEWSMLTQSNVEVCMGKWGHTVVPFHRNVDRAYYCQDSCTNEAGTISLAKQLIPVCNPTTTLPDPPVQRTILMNNNSMLTKTLYPDGCGLCMTDSKARYQNGTTLPALLLIAGNVGTQKVNDVFRSNDGMLCEKDGEICSGQGVCVQGGTCLCASGKAGAHCSSALGFTILDTSNCFPESAPVVVAGGRTRRLGDVVIGDSVLSLDATGKLVFSPVYYIPHDSLREGVTEFIRVEHDESDHVEALELTADHLVYYLPDTVDLGDASGVGLEYIGLSWDCSELLMASLQKPARELRVNDKLLVLPSPPRSCSFNNTETVSKLPRNASSPAQCSDDKLQAQPRQLADDELGLKLAVVKVTKLSRVLRNGAKTLYTTTGNFFVAGVLCSNFGDYYPVIAGYRRDWVAFELFAPHRAVYALLPYPWTAALLRALMDQLVLPALRWLLPLLSEQS